MRKNFNMDAAIRRALRESIEAHAHEWEPNFKTGVGPVGDDAPFDKKVSGDVNEGKDCEDCCPKCGKCPCECDKVNEGTIPGDSHEWEPGFETGVGEVGDDSPFTQAVNESLTDTNDWEDGSFGAGDHRKEGIAFADGGDECGNGVVATSQKNSGEVVSKDNLSEGEDEETKDEGGKDEGNEDELFGGIRRLAGKAGQAVGKAVNNAAQKVGNAYNTVKQEYQAGQEIDKQNQVLKQAEKLRQQMLSAQKAYSDFIAQNPQAKAVQGREGGKFTGAQTPAQQSVVNGKASVQQRQPTGQLQPALAEAKETEKDVIAEERDRFFNIINRIEKLYD